MDPLYFEDLPQGARFQSAAVTLDREAIVAFASAYDPQPQHVDETSALGSNFGKFIASGWHTSAITMRLQFDAMFCRIPGGAMGIEVEKLVWRRPVHPDDALHAVIEVKAARESRSRPKFGVLTIHTATLNQRDETVMEMTATIMVPRRPLGHETLAHS